MCSYNIVKIWRLSRDIPLSLVELIIVINCLINTGATTSPHFRRAGFPTPPESFLRRDGCHHPSRSLRLSPCLRGDGRGAFRRETGTTCRAPTVSPRQIPDLPGIFLQKRGEPKGGLLSAFPLALLLLVKKLRQFLAFGVVSSSLRRGILRRIPTANKTTSRERGVQKADCIRIPSQYLCAV